MASLPSERAIGADGYLADKGLVPLPRANASRSSGTGGGVGPGGRGEQCDNARATSYAALVDRSSLIHSVTMLAMLGLMMAAYMLRPRRASALTAGGGPRPCTPGLTITGFYVALWCGLPALLILALLAVGGAGGAALS